MVDNLSIQPQLPDDIYRLIFSYLPTRELPDLIFIEKRMRQVCQPLFDRALERDLTGLSKKKFQFFARVTRRECQTLSLTCKPLNEKEFVAYALQIFTNLKTLNLEKAEIKFEEFTYIQSALKTSLTSLTALNCYTRYSSGPQVNSEDFFDYFPTTLQQLKLRDFHFVGHHLPVDFFERFFKSHSHLTAIDFAQSCGDSPQVFQTLTVLTNLQSLSLQVGNGDKGSSLFFEPLTKLQHLEIRDYAPFAMDFSELFLPRLTYLSAPLAIDQSWEFLKECTQLKVLKFTNSINNKSSVSQDNYDILTRYVTQLQSLSFSDMTFSATQVLGIATCLTHLKDFGLLKKHGKQVISKIAQSMNQLTGLTFNIDLEENLEECMQQIALLTNLERLRLLYEGGDQYPTTTYLNHCTTLDQLKSLNCDYGSERDLEAICQSLTNLESLTFWLSSSFKSFEGLVSSNLTCLTSLTVYKITCPKGKNKEFFDNVANSAVPFFTQLTNLRGLIGRVIKHPTAAEPFLRERLKHLEYLNIKSNW